ncbi:hypothetical protein EXIGLDRAFT_192206 [Exidia glandulosa HHB12029]|uniref:Uncharacterized protein n=1 Tax=Exidia glandulosa HHB12029 TaxID=1314781 RepID=A0A165EXV7_EXIGL|nr:hypothetical protein EXIGLDRAFT_192206 [Exidia glandulosa HHB12029]
MLKLLRQSFDKVLKPGMREQIIARVQSVIDAFSSPNVAADEGHAPKHYARFLKNVLNKHVQRSSTKSPTSPSGQTGAGTGKKGRKSLQQQQQQQPAPQQMQLGQFQVQMQMPMQQQPQLQQLAPQQQQQQQSSFFGDALALRESPPLWPGPVAMPYHQQPIQPQPLPFNLDSQVQPQQQQWYNPQQQPQQASNFQQWNFGNAILPDPQAGVQMGAASASSFPIGNELASEEWWGQFHMPGFYGTLPPQPAAVFPGGGGMEFGYDARSSSTATTSPEQGAPVVF